MKDRLAKWGKAPVLVKKDLPGQLANRILQAMIREAVEALVRARPLCSNAKYRVMPSSPEHSIRQKLPFSRRSRPSLCINSGSSSSMRSRRALQT